MQFLTASEAADFLKIKIDTIYSLVEKDELPGAKVGGQWRFIDDKIIDWFKARSATSPKKRKVGAISEYEVSTSGMYQSLIEATFDAYLISKQNVIIDCNHNALDHFGYDEEQIIGLHLKNIMAPDFHTSLQKSLESNWTGILQRVHLRSDGTAIPVQVSMKSFQDGEEILRLAAISNISNLPTDQLTKEVRDCLGNCAVTSITPPPPVFWSNNQFNPLFVSLPIPGAALPGHQAR
jgi:PAS domain S-box-containing protein/excisionase family DNA binding protein